MTESTRPGREPETETEVDPIPAPAEPEPLEPGDEGEDDDEPGASTVDEDTLESTDAKPKHRRPDVR